MTTEQEKKIFLKKLQRIVLNDGEKDIACRDLLHNHGLIQVTDILEKYEIGSATDVSEIKKDDFSALEVL